MSAPSSPCIDTTAIASALEGLEPHWIVTPDDIPTVELDAKHVHDALTRLKQDAQFELCTLVTAIDHFPDEPRFQVVWQLLSLARNQRVRVYARVSSDNAVVATCTDLWPGAAFSERECYDMFGIQFEGHENLRRLMMPDGYDHHPLRKDFPHQGIQPDRLYREWDNDRRGEWEANKKGGAQ